MQDRYSKAEIEKEVKEILNILNSYKVLAEDHRFMHNPSSGLGLLCKFQMGLCDKNGAPQKGNSKYVRPMICLAVCEAMGGDNLRMIPGAASIELIHRASLVFDDIQDNGEERNQRPTMWKIWGPSQAINAGLALSCYARIALYKLWEKGLPEGTVMKIWVTLEKAVLNLCRGQYKDIEMVGSDRETTLDTYIDMISGKTAALFRAACEVGVMGSGELGIHYIGRAGHLGTCIGILFQMHDDYLGVWGGDAVGKTANDLVEKKQSLPVVLALGKDPIIVKDLLARQQTDDLRQWMKDNRIPQMVKAQEDIYRLQAEELLSGFPPGEATNYIKEMIAFFMARDK